MRAYHLSYDAKDLKENFGDNYDEAKRFIVCVLMQTKFVSIKSYTASTFIVHYNGNIKSFSDKLFKYLKSQLSPYFHYTISRIAKYDKSDKIILSYNANKNIEQDLDKLIANITCNFKGKPIAKF